MQDRVKWIDTAKGLGALYVIIGHFILNGKIRTFIYAFHMPLFFFLAGITLNIKEKESFYVFLKKKFNSIIIPYIVFSIPLLLLNFARIIYEGKDINTLLIKRLLGIFVCWKTTDYYNGVWFLPCIFIAYLISYVIIKNTKSKVIISVLSIASLILGLTFDAINLSLPLCIDTALIAFCFMGIAYVSKSLINKIKWFGVILYIPMGIIAYLNYNISGARIEMYSNDYANYVLFVLAAFCGIIATVGLANIRILANNALLSFFGKESLYMYGWQLPFKNIMTAILPRTGIYSLSSFVRTIIGLVFSCTLIMILLKLKPLYYCILKKFTPVHETE